MSNIERWEDIGREVIAWARKADVPLMSPPRVPEAAQSMSEEIVRLRDQLQGAVSSFERVGKLAAWIERDRCEPDKVIAYAQELAAIVTRHGGQFDSVSSPSSGVPKETA